MLPQRAREATRRGALTSLALLVAVTGAGCALGFDTFDPPAAGSAEDAGTVEGATDAELDSADGGLTAPDTGAALDSGLVADTSTAQDSAANDAATEASCPGQPACLSTATTCGNACIQDYQTCTGMCQGGNQQQCRNACKQTEQHCRTSCAQTCDSCANSAGCPDNAGCTSASQM